ncbi:MAG: hypothetical protein V3T83_15315, partial [Acidobacteriota bacterium]
MRRLSVYLLFFLLSGMSSLVEAQSQEPTPAVVSLVATPSFTGRDGTLEKPFNGSAIELFLEIEDDTPASYIWGGWQVAPAGFFCPGGFQYFGTEGRLFSLKHPRMRSGTGSIRIMGFFQEEGFALRTVEKTFYLEAHPEGCAGEGGGDSPSGLSLQVSPPSASFGQTVTLTATAQSQSNSLTFLFYVSSSSQASSTGTLIGTRTGSGCQNGCSASTAFQVADFPATHFFMFEAQDASKTTASEKKAVQVSANGGGGGGGPSPPDDPDSPTVCQPCGGTVDAGPVTTTVVGGESLSL